MASAAPPRQGYHSRPSRIPFPIIRWTPRTSPLCSYYRSFTERLVTLPSEGERRAAVSLPTDFCLLTGTYAGYFRVPRSSATRAASCAYDDGLPDACQEYAASGLVFRPHTRGEVSPVQGEMVYALARRSFGHGAAPAVTLVVHGLAGGALALQAARFGPGRHLCNVLAAGDGHQLDGDSLSGAFCLSLLLSPALDKAAHRVGADGRIERLPGQALFANAVETDATTGEASVGVLSALYASPHVAATRLSPGCCQRVVQAAPGCLLLRWLADVAGLAREVERLREEGALPPDLAQELVAPARLCQGVASRMHRTWSGIQAALHNADATGGLALGVLLARLMPVLGAVYARATSLALGEGATFQHLRMGEVRLADVCEPGTALAAALASPGPLERALGTLDADRISPAAAAQEILFYSDTEDPLQCPLRRYSNELKLELAHTLVTSFPEVKRAGLPTMWQDAATFHGVIQGSSPRLELTPMVMGFFHDFVNARDRDGTPPLLRLVRTSRGPEAKLLLRVKYLCALGSELDGCDARGYSAVDHCAEQHTLVFMWLVGAGAAGGKRTMMLAKMFNRLSSESEGEDKGAISPRLLTLPPLHGTVSRFPSPASPPPGTPLIVCPAALRPNSDARVPAGLD